MWQNPPPLQAFLQRDPHWAPTYSFRPLHRGFLFLFLLFVATLPTCFAVAHAATATIVPLYLLQGAGVASPYAEQWVDTVGLVTGVVSDGFYLQDPVGDGDPATSDGIFVYTRTAPTVVAGQCVLLQRAYVDEFYEKTELSRMKAIVPSTACPATTVTPVTIPAPSLVQTATERFERFEGMVVALQGVEALVQGPTVHFADGEREIALLAKAHLTYVDGGRVLQSASPAMNALLYLSNLLGAPLPEVRWGDTVLLGDPTQRAPTVQGILDYNFGKYQLLLRPDSAITTRRLTSPLPPPGTIQAATNDDLTVCTYNLHGMGRGSEQYWDAEEYDHQLAKRVRTIAESLAGCLIIGLQEAGMPEDVERLTALLQSAYGLDYAGVAIPGPNTQSNVFPLTNGLLARRDRVDVVAAEARQGCSAIDYEIVRLTADCPLGRYPLFNRPPLIVDVMVHGSWKEPFLLTLIVNHWKSKGGDETVNVVRRTAQATHVAALVQERLALDPLAQLVVLGDLNDYDGSGPLEQLRTGANPPLRHTYDYLPTLDRYSYIYNGGSQVLDHILVTPSLEPFIARVDPVHVNADYPGGDNEQVALLQKSSDHDPVLLQLRPAGSGILGGNLSFPHIGLTLLQETGEPEHKVAPTGVSTTSGGATFFHGVDEDMAKALSVVSATTTDASGEFRFWGLTPGTYYLRIDAPAHFSQSAQTGILSIAPGYQTLVLPPLHGTGGDDSAFIHQDLQDAVAVMQLTPLLLGQLASANYGTKDRTP